MRLKIFNRIKNIREDRKLMKELLSKAKNIDKSIDLLYGLLKSDDNNIGFELFEQFELFQPYQISDGLMVSIQRKEKDTIYLAAHYESGSRLKFHNHKNATEIIIHIAGTGKAVLKEYNRKTKKYTEREIVLKPFEVIKIDSDVFHSWVIENKALSMVILKRKEK